MKRIFRYAMVALLALSAVNCSRDDGKDGIDGINGVDGINGKTIRSGKGAPAESLGAIGDFYLNLDNYYLYGPKSENGWGTPISLIGAKGDKGDNGKDGANGKDAPKIWTGNTAPTGDIGSEGDFYLDLQNKILYGPKTGSGWGSGLSLVITHPFLREDYLISRDGKTLLHWFNKQTLTLDMEADEELKHITTIGGNTFQYSDLYEIKLPRGLKTIGRGAFFESSLTSIEFPSGLTEIKQAAFVRNKLTSVTLPNGITKVERHTFSGNQMADLHIPNSVTIIEEYAFYDNKLTTLTLPNKLISIGRYAFERNPLKEITIPRSVAEIGDFAFYNGERILETVIMESPKPPRLGNNVFYPYNNNFRIYVPANSVDAYKQHSDWDRYSNYIYAR